MHKKLPGFTIVELLVVIVIIGILAAVTIVSYAGIANQAIVASLKSDLSGAAKNFKLYTVEYGSYPTAIAETSGGSGVWCASAPTTDSKYCLKLSGGNLRYSYTGTATTFRLVARNGSNFYAITEGSEPIALTVPVLINPTSTAITSSGATIGATIQSDGGETITESGTCWGTSVNPTGNCTPTVPGTLTDIGSIATAAGSIDVAISGDGKSIYVSGGSSPNRYISMYSRNTSTGLLTALATPTIAAGTTDTSYGITVSPDNTSVYSVNYGVCGSLVRMYSRNTSTGALTALATPTIAASCRAYDVAVSPDNNHAYVSYYSAAGIGVHSRNTSTGALTYISSASTGTGPRDIVISPDGLNVYSAVSGAGNVAMFSRNTSTGALTALSPANIAAVSNVSGITISSDGKFIYTANGSGNNISMYSRDPATGLLTALSPASIAAGSSPYHISVSPDGASVYASNFLGNTISIYSRNTSTGLLTAMGSPTIATGSAPVGVLVSPDGNYVYVANQGSNTVSTYSRSNGVGMVGVPFVQARVSMSSGTTIHYRGYSINGIGTGYSADATFTTL